MPWVEVFAVFVVCHLVGDYLLQTDWQATNKRGGLGRDPLARRALLSHIVDLHARLRARASSGSRTTSAPRAHRDRGRLISVPHLVQDDGRLLARYMVRVKDTGGAEQPAVAAAVDQSFHFLALFLTRPLWWG